MAPSGLGTLVPEWEEEARDARAARVVAVASVRVVKPAMSAKDEGGVRGGQSSFPSDTPDCLFVDDEAEHHAALVVLGDVAVSHPVTGVGDLEQDVDGLAGAH
jgi:hypothetical protein